MSRGQQVARRRRKRGSSGYLAYALGGAVTLVAVAVVIAAGAVARGGGSSDVVVPPSRSAEVPQAGHVLGDPDAAVVIVEYLDFQCPHCRRAATEVMPAIEREFIATGVARLEVRPVAFLGSESLRAAAAAESAGEQGQFWAYYDILMANQGREGGGAFSDAKLKEFAAALGLETDAFSASFDSGRYVAQVQREGEDARDAGVGAVPTIMVDGTPVAANVNAISAAIDEAAGP